ncbi:MAG: septum formation protein Maf [Clostridia bacterium]|nr:septum formation protein Maf [Clostridia bacterium]MBR2324022.1 septum formation protein Maf [Clostridia bacterium]MBR2397393.1 septum formation protein Maf [Clostridia bacterium]
MLYNIFMEYILASASPRRIELFKEISKDFTVLPADVDESIEKLFDKKELDSLLNSSPQSIVMELAKIKAMAIASNHPNSLVVGADTGVFLDGKMLGKPVDKEDAIRLLKMLSGKTHHVITGFCIMYKDKIITDFENTIVVFENLDDFAIDRYIKSGQYKGKAGAYGIQDGYGLVKEYIGDLNNVIGFPTEKIKKRIKEVLE